jgi:transposase-like protein
MEAAQNGSNGRERRHFSPEQKVAIVKQHLVDGVPISDLCDRHHIQPTQFYQWQKQLFENGSSAFERKTKSAGPTPAERQVEALRAKLITKNEVIAELLEENVHLKKLDGAF